MSQQLNLFGNIVQDLAKQFPFYKKPNKKQAEIIKETFGGAEQIAYFLGDILDLYPCKSYWWNGWTKQVFLCIGASCTQHNYFYMLEIETASIYLEHQFSNFPYLKGYKQ